jgi:acyl-CoA dehydrogenase
MKLAEVRRDALAADPQSCGMPRGADLKASVAAVVAVATAHADEVDQEARFPHEAIAAARAAGLLGLMADDSVGGDRTTIKTIVDICYRLGRACASTAMIYAMHQTKVACIQSHGRGSHWHNELLRRLARENLLFASSTTEGMAGGNVRVSAAALSHTADRITLERDASVISYGAEADAIVTTARRAEDAAASDQVLVVFMKEDYQLTPTRDWDTLGMRGTASRGFALKATGAAAQILPEPYAVIHTRTMTPVAHLLWAAAWAGIAASAVERARLFTRKAAAGANGRFPPGVGHLTTATASLERLQSLIGTALRSYLRSRTDEGFGASLEFQKRMTLLKVDASELAVATVLSAMRAGGLAAYRNDGTFALGRHLRDILSAPLMINNDRILTNMTSLMMMADVPATLVD